jgi:hypothetical protein
MSFIQKASDPKLPREKEDLTPQTREILRVAFFIRQLKSAKGSLDYPYVAIQDRPNIFPQTRKTERA